jgi:hypothetical protein
VLEVEKYLPTFGEGLLTMSSHDIDRKARQCVGMIGKEVDKEATRVIRKPLQ